MATTGHESEAINVGGLKGSLQKLKTDILPSVPHYVTSAAGTAGSTTSGAYNRTRWTGNAAGISALATGAMVLYKIPVAGCKYGVTLNVNSLGEKPVVLNVSTNISTAYGVGAVLPLVYDADQEASVYVDNVSTQYTGCWKIANYDSNTTYTPEKLGFCTGECDTAAATKAKTVTMTDYALLAQGIVSIKFTNAITVASATLNINSKGAKAIYYKGAALAANVIAAGDIVTMQYNNSKYVIIGILRSTGNLDNVSYNSTTGKLQKTVDGTTTDVAAARNIVIDALGLSVVNGKVCQTYTVQAQQGE